MVATARGLMNIKFLKITFPRQYLYRNTGLGWESNTQVGADGDSFELWGNFGEEKAKSDERTEEATLCVK